MSNSWMGYRGRKKIRGGNSFQEHRSLFYNIEHSQLFFPLFVTAIFLGVVIMFRDFMFSEHMLYGSDTFEAGVFFRHYLVEQLKAKGTVPGWNPFIYGGMPFIDAFHGDTFYPLSILKLFGNFFRALGMTLVIHVFLAGIFMYCAARGFSMSRLAASMSAVAYSFSACFVSLVRPGHDGKMYVIALFPLTILLMERAFKGRPILNFSLLTLVLGLIFLSPHPQLSYFTLWALALYGVYKLSNLYLEKRSFKPLLMPFLLMWVSVLGGLSISAVQFYPGYVYTTEDSPRFYSKQGFEWASTFSMNEEELFSQLLPEFAGREGTYWGKNPIKNNSEYVGVISLLLAVLGFWLKRRKHSVFFAILGSCSLLYALGPTTPFFHLLYSVAPYISACRAPSNIMFLYLFSVSILAGFGVQAIIDLHGSANLVKQRRLVVVLVAVPSAYLIMSLLWSAVGQEVMAAYTGLFYAEASTLTAGVGGISRFQLGLLNLPDIRTGSWILFALLLGVSASVILFWYKKASVLVLMAVPILAMVDGIRFNDRFIDSRDIRSYIAENELTKYLRSQPGTFRVLNLGAVPKNYLPYHGIQVVSGYHGNQLRWYDQLLGGTRTENILNPRLLNLLGAKYILVDTTKVGSAVHGVLADLRRVDTAFGPLVLFENPHAMPRASLVLEYEVIESADEIRDSILQGADDLRIHVFLEEEPFDQPFDTVNLDTSLLVDIADYTADSVVVNVQTTGDAVLLLTDTYYRSWRAWVDGLETSIIRADGAFRAVAVPAGSRQVVFTYDYGAYKIPATFTFLGILLVCGGIVYGRLRE